MRHMRHTAVATLLLLVALLASACAGDSPSSGDQAVERAMPAVAEDGASTSTDVITRGTASVRTGEPESAAADFSAAVRSEGGRVEMSEAGTRGGHPRAEVTVRIPAERYEAVVDTLADYGEVVSQSTQATDVTRERVDLQARQEALRGSVDRLTELMTGADSVEDLLRAEEMLTQRQAELDSLSAQLDHLVDQVTMSTLTVTFTVDDDGHQPPGVGERMWDAFLTSVETLVIVAVGVLPWLVVIGLVLAVVLAVLRRRRRTSDPESDA